MAGPLSSEEIEDVVSSVRRLVSNEQRPRALSRDLNSDRLLLTPALRVMPEASPLAPLMLDAQVLDTLLSEANVSPAAFTEEQPDTSAQAVVLEDTDAPMVFVADEADEPFTAVEGTTQDFDPDLAADPAEAGPEAQDTEWEDEIWVEPATVSLGEIALAVDEAEVLAGSAPDDERPARDQAHSQGEGFAPVESPLENDEPIPFVPLRRRAEHLAARPAAGEVEETLHPEAEGEPDVISVPENNPAALRPDDVAASDPDRVATEFLDADGMPLAVLDELALQEIVRQTLRAELQGELGERITRNVRKLVRAEINRALMARDLD